MHISPAARVSGAILVLALVAGCGSAPVGSRASLFQQPVNDYQRQLAAADARRGVPYTIPPETPGAPLAAPMTAPMEPALSSQPLPVTPPAQAAALPPLAEAPRPGGVADTASYTPIPFGQRPAGAEIAPVGTTEVVTVAAVPAGQGSGPNVVAYALQTTHGVGTQLHRRSNPLRNMRWESACRAFPNQDAAQEAFLAAGGPERDPQNLDPDGDGFACWWDPSVYRQAARLGAAPVE